MAPSTSMMSTSTTSSNTRSISKTSNATSFAKQPAYTPSRTSNPYGNLTQQLPSRSNGSHQSHHTSRSNSNLVVVDASDILNKEWSHTKAQAIIKYSPHLRLINNKLLKHLCGPILWKKAEADINQIQAVRPVGVKDLDYLAYKYLKNEKVKGNKMWSWNDDVRRTYRNVQKQWKLPIEKMVAPFRMLEFETLTIAKASCLLIYQFYHYKQNITAFRSHGSIFIKNDQKYEIVELPTFRKSFTTSEIIKLYSEIKGDNLHDFAAKQQCKSMNVFNYNTNSSNQSRSSGKSSKSSQSKATNRVKIGSNNVSKSSSKTSSKTSSKSSSKGSSKSTSNKSLLTSLHGNYTDYGSKSDSYSRGLLTTDDEIRSTGGCSQRKEIYDGDSNSLSPDEDESSSENDYIQQEAEEEPNSARKKRRKLNNGNQKEVGQQSNKTTTMEAKDQSIEAQDFTHLIKDISEPMYSETIVCDIFYNYF